MEHAKYATVLQCRTEQKYGKSLKLSMLQTHLCLLNFSTCILFRSPRVSGWLFVSYDEP